MTSHGHRQAQGGALGVFLGILLLLVIGGLCAYGGYYLGLKQRPEQVNLGGNRINTTSGVPTLNDNDLLSRAVPYSENDLRDQCVRLKFAPLQRGDLAFDMLVPKNWNWQTVQVSEADLAQSNTREVQIAEIESPGSSLAIIQAWFMQVPDGVSLSQFADSYTRARGFKMVERAAEVGNRMDMLIGYDTAKQKDIQSRVTAMKVGKNVMWIACCAPRSEYPVWNKVFTLAANTFSPAAAPIAFQPDVPTKLAQGAILGAKDHTITDSKGSGTPALGDSTQTQTQTQTGPNASPQPSTGNTGAKQTQSESTTTTTERNKNQPSVKGPSGQQNRNSQTPVVP